MAVRNISQANDVQVGFDQNFERKWVHLERAVWVAFALLLAAGILGVFGRGVLGWRTQESAGMKVRYERMARLKTPTITRVTVPTSQNGTVQFSMTGPCLQAMKISSVTPRPASEQIVPDGVQFTFAGRNGDVEIAQEPGKSGSTHCQLTPANGSPINISQFVLP
jgi:hypothetical protein